MRYTFSVLVCGVHTVVTVKTWTLEMWYIRQLPSVGDLGCACPAEPCQGPRAVEADAGVCVNDDGPITPWLVTAAKALPCASCTSCSSWSSLFLLSTSACATLLTERNNTNLEVGPCWTCLRHSANPSISSPPFSKAQPSFYPEGHWRAASSRRKKFLPL